MKARFFFLVMILLAPGVSRAQESNNWSLELDARAVALSQGGAEGFLRLTPRWRERFILESYFTGKPGSLFNSTVVGWSPIRPTKTTTINIIGGVASPANKPRRTQLGAQFFLSTAHWGVAMPSINWERDLGSRHASRFAYTSRVFHKFGDGRFRVGGEVSFTALEHSRPKWSGGPLIGGSPAKGVAIELYALRQPGGSWSFRIRLFRFWP